MFLYVLNSGMSEMERQQAIKRTSDTMARLAREGKLKKKPIYGWRSLGKGVPPVEDPEEQKVIHQIKELRKDNMNDNAIARTLNEMQIPCRKSKQWYCSRISTIRQQNKIE